MLPVRYFVADNLQNDCDKQSVVQPCGHQLVKFDNRSLILFVIEINSTKEKQKSLTIQKVATLATGS